MDHHDLWQRARLTLALVSREAGETDDRLSHASRLLHSDPAFQVVDESRELVAVSDDHTTAGACRVARPERSTRMRRVDAALRQVLAETVARELSDPRLGFVTITHVEATQDSREAKVWFTTLKPRDRAPSQEALESARGLLQARVAAELAAATPRSSPSTTTRSSRTPRPARLIDQVTGGPGRAAVSRVAARRDASPARSPRCSRAPASASS